MLKRQPNSIEDILDCSLTVFKDFDLTSTAYQTGNSFVSKPTVHDAENGADISSGAFRWNNNTTNWCPAIPGERVAYFQAKAQILDAASLTAEGTSVDASADGATSVKVFNWNNFTQLNRVIPAITLGL